MWVFLGRQFRRWLLVALAMPLIGWFLERVGVRLERRYGPKGPVRVLRTGGDWLSGQSAGPLARRLRRKAS